MERTIDGQERNGNPKLAAPGRGARARRLGLALAVLVAAFGQQALAGEARNLVFCEKLKRTGESKGVVVRTEEEGCRAKEQQIPLSAVLGLVAPDSPPPNPQTLVCEVRDVTQHTTEPIQVDCLEGETVTGGGLYLADEDRFQGELVEASYAVDNGWNCDAGVTTEVHFSCYAVCCHLE